MKKALLNQLVRDVRSIKPKQFMMESFVCKLNMGRTCKSVGCAVGTYIIKHPRSQIKLEAFGHKFIDGKKYDEYQVAYKTFYGFEACAKYFGISCEDSRYLFDPDYYDERGKELTKQVVVKRIQEYIDSNGESALKYYHENDYDYEDDIYYDDDYEDDDY